MVVGFVNAGIMTLVQGISVVFGAHVGTTLSLWLLTLNVAQYGGLVVGTAVFFYLFSKSERVRYFGMAFMGLGMLFFGLQLLVEGFEPMRAWYTFATACVHTIFNVSATVALFPFIGLFARFVTFLIPVRESERARAGFRARYIDPNLVGQPALALAQAQKEILRMGETCLAMLADLRAVLAAPEDDDEDEETEERVFRAETDLDVAQTLEA